MLPVSSIAFATDYNLNSVKSDEDPIKIENEFLDRLAENELPLKYYRFLLEHDIRSSEQLLSEEYSFHKKRLIEEYIQDYKIPMARVGGTISVF